MSMLLTETSTSVLYGGLTFGAVDGSGVLWRLTKLDGWGSPDSTIQPVPKPRQRGAWAGDAYSQERYVTVTLFLRAPTPALLNQSLDALDSACDFATQPFTVNEAGFSRTINVRRKLGVQPNKISSTTAAPTFQVVATDPRKFGAAIVASTGLPSTTGGLVVPTGQLLRTNLCTNPRMLTLTGWANATTANMTQTATASGQQYDVTASSAGGIPITYQSNAITVSPGDLVGTSMKVTVPAGFPAVTLYLDAQEYMSGGTGITAHGANVTVQTGQTVTIPSGILTVDANGNGFRSVLRFGATAAVGARIIVANCLVEKAGAVGPYFDGTTADSTHVYAWTGTPDASTSTQSSLNGLTIPAGGLTIPATVTSGQLEMFNPGNETGPVEIRFDGDVTGPRVTHAGTGLSVTFSTDLSLGVGAFLDVDMEAHTALEQGQASRTRYITSRGWFGFDPGWNTYAFAATSGTAGTMTVTAYPAWR